MYPTAANCQKRVCIRIVIALQSSNPTRTDKEGCRMNVTDGAKEKLLEYLRDNKSDLAVRVILSHG